MPKDKEFFDLLKTLLCVSDLPSNEFVRYVSSSRETVFTGNRNTYSVVENLLNPPIIANKIRVLPFSRHPRTVCMRVEIKGCPFTGKHGLMTLVLALTSNFLHLKSSLAVQIMHLTF